jgi:hypothetical protein
MHNFSILLLKTVQDSEKEERKRSPYCFGFLTHGFDPRLDG